MFQRAVLKSVKQDEGIVALRWAKFQEYLAKKEFVQNVKEEKYQDGFLKDVFESCLGYTLDSTDPANFNLEREKKNETDGKKADGAIYLKGEVIGIIELKAQDTKNLDKATDQAFGYLVSNSNAHYVVVSNFDELRFYIDKKTALEKFSLFNLSYEEFKKLHLLLSYESIKEQIPLKLKEKSANFEAQISKELYKDFSVFRNHLFENMVKNNPAHEKSDLLRYTQKLCDRIIFILFAEDRGLLQPNTIKEIRTRHEQDIFGNPMYGYYKIYFDAINEGNQKLQIPRYNGGLFAKDERLDSLIIDNEYLDMEAQKLSDYDFASEVGVNILGHIFEQSLTDLEEIQSNIDNIDFDKSKSKRKKDGVFYTPEYITRYIVENTLGKLCREKREELELVEVTAPKNLKKLTQKEQQTKDNLETYKNWLFELKILDPACGSGAFLNQALDFLINEHTALQKDLALMGDLFASYQVEESVLEHNLYGVDINEDAVEIAKLSLWLRTAHKGRELTKLADKIKCGNSLIDDKTVADNAFVWEEEFPEVFAQGGFDVVIGNPPYGAKLDKQQSEFIINNYNQNVSGEIETYIAFYLVLNRLLKHHAFCGYITPDTWLTIQKAKSLRENFLNNFQLIEVFDRYKPFIDAKDTRCHTVILSNKHLRKYTFNVKVVNAKNDVLKAYSLNSDLLCDTTFWNIYISPIEQNIFIKMKKFPFLENVAKLKYGLRTGDNSKYISECDETKLGLKIARGSNIERYLFKWEKEYLIKKEGLPESYFKEEELREKIIIQYVRTNSTDPKSRWIEPCLIDELNYVPLNSTSYIYGCSLQKLKYLLAVLSSNLINVYYKAHYTDVNVKPLYLSKLPIPEISNEEQAPFIEKADQMLLLNKKLQETKQNFIKELDLEKITKKLQNFEELEFDDFVKECAKAKKLKFAGKLEERNFKQEWQALFENDKTLASQLQDEISKTDKEIDQMVYKLYDLTKDEIKIVEGV